LSSYELETESAQSVQADMKTVVDVDHPVQTIKHPARPNQCVRHAAAARMYAEQGWLLVLPERLVGFAARVRRAAHNIPVLWKVAFNLPHREARATGRAPASAPADWNGQCPLQPGCSGMRLSCRYWGSVARLNRRGG